MHNKQRNNKENQDTMTYIMIQPIFLYGLECWSMEKQDEKRILSIEISSLPKIAGISGLQKIINDGIQQL